jgi:hypothetical protein
VKLSLGKASVVLLALFLVSDGLTRLMPLGWFSFRGWEPLAAAREPSGPFARDEVFDSTSAFGDLASFAADARLRVYRRETFTTDAFGFRRGWEPETPTPPVGIVTGDSFAVGSSLSDHETLSSQLARRLGRPVYNAGGARAASLGDLLAIRERLKMTRGWVLLVHLERAALPDETSFDGNLYSSAPARSPGQRLWDLAQTSRLEILFGRLHRDFIAPPSRNAHDTWVGVLPNGTRMLFYSGDEATSFVTRDVSKQGFSTLARRLAEAGLELVVLLVPNKLTVYGPMAGRTAGVGALSALEARLKADGVRVLNLEGPMVSAARERLPRGELLYWQDDTHWNAHGVALAAELVEPLLPVTP